MLRQCRLETNSKFWHKGTAIFQLLQPVDMSNLKERELINTLSQNIFQENEIFTCDNTSRSSLPSDADLLENAI